MEYIKSYFLNIIAVILFTVVVEILMSNSSFKGYIKLVLGLLVIFTVIKPLTTLTSIDFASFYTSNEAVIASSQIEEVQNSQINNIFCEKLENTIAYDVENKFGKTITVSVDADTNEIREITVFGIPAEYEHDITSYISSVYGVKNVSTGR